MASVQFYGIDVVTEAAKNRDCPAWAIFQGSQFMFKCERGTMDESLQLLEEILTKLEESESEAVYTIKFYEEYSGKIKDKTPHDGSFNFKLCAKRTELERREMITGGHRKTSEILERIDARLAILEGDDDEIPDANSLNGIAMGLLKEPEKIGQLVEAGKQLLGLLGIGKPSLPIAAMQAPTIGNVPGTEVQTINESLAILKKNDPRIAEHLHKLAQISEHQKATWNYLISLLDNMK